MSSSNATGSQQPAGEDTPLLRDTEGEPAGAAATDAQRDSPAGEEAAHDGSPVQDQHARTRKRLFILTWALIALPVLLLVLAAVVCSMLNYGNRWYGVWDWVVETELIINTAWICVIGILFTGLNIARLRSSGKLIPPLLNVIVFGCLAFAATSFAAYLGTNFHDQHLCSRGDLEGPYYPGTWKQCLSWEAKYMAACWILVALFGMFALANLVLVIFVLVSLYRGRSSWDDSRQSTWRLPAGQFSVQIAFRWGSQEQPAVVTQGAREPARTEAS